MFVCHTVTRNKVKRTHLKLDGCRLILDTMLLQLVGYVSSSSLRTRCVQASTEPLGATLPSVLRQSNIDALPVASQLQYLSDSGARRSARLFL